MSSWDDLVVNIPYSEWATPRYKGLDRLERTLMGNQYAHLRYPFYFEVDPSNKQYIPLNERRPSVIYRLGASVVQDTVDKLFSGRHWPHYKGQNESLIEELETLTRKTNLEPAMRKAAFIGSIGSSFVTFKFVNNVLSFDVWNPKNCLPVFDETGELEEVKIFYKAKVDSLLALGYKLNEQQVAAGDLWWGKRYTKTEEILYVPSTEADPPAWDEWPVDQARSKAHDLGFVPGRWIENLPGGVFPDGACTFENLLEMTVEIDYQLSQAGRGFKYSAAPQLAVRGLANMEIRPNGRTIVRSPANILELTPGDDVTKPGDAKLLEMQGQGLRATMEYVKLLRGYALETTKGSRKDPERLTAIPMSGKAMEALEEELLDLVQSLRESYGDHGLLPLLKLVMRAGEKLGIVKNYNEKDFDDIQLLWPKVFLPGAAEIQEYATALLQAVQGAFILPEMANMLLQVFLDLPHPLDMPVMSGAPTPDPTVVFGSKVPVQPPEPEGSDT